MLPPMPTGLSATQTANTYAIWREFARAYPNESIALGLAAIVNAKAESNIENVKTGYKGEDSAGLFQLNVTNPHGAALVGIIDRRYWPSANTRGIIASLVDSGGPVFSALRANDTVSNIAGLFRRYVEKPADAIQKQDATERLTYTVWPQYASVRANDLPKMGDLIVPPSPVLLLALAAGAAGAVYYFGGFDG